MFIDLTPEQHALRLRVRDYFSALMTPELRLALRGAESGALFRDTVRRMGSDGWLAVGWPKAYGGQGYSGTEQLIFFEEANIAGAPLPFVTISTVGRKPMLAMATRSRLARSTSRSAIPSPTPAATWQP